MRVIARIIPGPRWQCGRSVYEQGPAIQAHLAYMKARYEEGSLLIGGPFTTGLSGIAVLEVPDLRAATDLAQSDPAVAAGVLVYELDELRALFDVVSASRPHAAAS